ncbi:MAG TPA: cytochrome d ubiquinol oxidase subunit II [Vicinamibacterales bacterium]|nr:cytochrome d ubiquinol oxidase subunit II [Vicinamibacterales bacterium]
MATLWFVLVALMLVAYSILDGLDLGAGTVHWLVGRTSDERRLVLRTIGPVWDGNEVWLLAAGGTLYFAFPALYASSFSGFYLPLMMVLWLLMLRGISIEIRAHVDEPLWHSFYDAVFTLSSALLAIFLGAALGNVIRGVPLDAAGYFFEPLWTTFTVSPQPGVLDWYTVLIGVMSFATLANHGALWLTAKTEEPLRGRAHALAGALWWAVALLTLVGLAATLAVRPAILDNYRRWWPGWLIPVVVVAGLAGMAVYRRRNRDLAAFLASSLYIAGMLGGVAFGMYPTLLPAVTDPAYSLTVANSAAGLHGLQVGLVWWCFGVVLAVAYFSYLYWTFRSRVRPGGEGAY